MNHKGILKRAWKILWSYRVLWVFGIILGLTTASGGQRTFNYTTDRTSRVSQPTPEFLGGSFQEGIQEATREIERLFADVIPEEWAKIAIIVAIALGCLILFFIILSTIFRYISRTALIQMVNDYEETGENLTIIEGFRIGWSHKSWQLFLIDILIGLPCILVFVLLFFIILAPLMFWATDNLTASIFGTVMTIGLFVVGIFLVIIVATAISLLSNFFRRVCVLENQGIIDSIRTGFQIVRDNLVNIGLMWLITLGINIGFTIVMIPVVFFTILVAGVISGVVGLIAAGTIGLLISPLGVGLSVGIPIFIILLILPAAFTEGLRQTYISTTWTLTFREIRLLEIFESDHDEQTTDVDDTDLVNNLPAAE